MSRNSVWDDNGKYDLTYYDCPSELDYNGSFEAELTLVKQPYVSNANQKRVLNIPIVITLKYGFTVNNGKMNLTPIKVVKPSPFQIQTLKQIRIK